MLVLKNAKIQLLGAILSMWVWNIPTNHHLGLPPGRRLAKGPDENYGTKIYWQKILVSQSNVLQLGNGEVQQILTATRWQAQ